MDCGFEEVGAFLQRELIEEGADSDPESVDASLDGFAEQRFQLYLAWWTLIKSYSADVLKCLWRESVSPKSSPTPPWWFPAGELP
jgi:hypothetical protein